LREYKGVTYRDGKWWFRELSYDKAARLIAIVCGFTDTDHAALLALRDDPYEPVPTLEAVVQSWYEAEIADAPEMDTNDLCVRLRAAFPHLDAPRALTAGEHGPEQLGFVRELAELINRHSLEGGSNTPDFILAEFLSAVHTAWDAAVQQRESWKKPLPADTERAP
jgi:hypothetical protein